MSYTKIKNLSMFIMLGFSTACVSTAKSDLQLSSAFASPEEELNRFIGDDASNESEKEIKLEISQNFPQCISHILNNNIDKNIIIQNGYKEGGRIKNRKTSFFKRRKNFLFPLPEYNFFVNENGSCAMSVENTEVPFGFLTSSVLRVTRDNGFKIQKITRNRRGHPTFVFEKNGQFYDIWSGFIRRGSVRAWIGLAPHKIVEKSS